MIKALLIGVSSYPPRENILPQVQADLPQMQTALQGAIAQSPSGADDHAVWYVSDRPRQEVEGGIKDFLTSLSDTDTALFLFAGYGFRAPSGELFLVTNPDSDLPNEQVNDSNNFIAASSVQRLMQQCSAGLQVLILDCIWRETFLQVPGGSQPEQENVVELLQQFGGDSRQVILTATIATQHTPPAPKGQSYSHYIAEAIATGAADTDLDGVVSATDLHEYARHKLEAISSLEPQILCENMEVANLPLLQLPPPSSALHNQQSQRLKQHDQRLQELENLLTPDVLQLLQAIQLLKDDSDPHSRLTSDAPAVPEMPSPTRFLTPDRGQPAVQESPITPEFSNNGRSTDTTVAPDRLTETSATQTAAITTTEITEKFPASPDPKPQQDWRSPLPIALVLLLILLIPLAMIYGAWKAGLPIDRLLTFDWLKKPNQPSAAQLKDWGQMKAQQGYNRAAVEEFSKAIEVEPKDSGAYVSRGVAYERLGDANAALKDYDTAISLDPRAAIAYNNRSHLYYDRKEHQKAFDDANQATILAPTLAEAYVNLGNARMMTSKDTLGAIQDYNRAINLKPETSVLAGAHTNRGNAIALNNAAAALLEYDQAIQLDPNYAEAYYNRAAVQQVRGNAQAATNDFNEAARLYLNKGEKTLSEDALDRAKKVPQSSPTPQPVVTPLQAR